MPRAPTSPGLPFVHDAVCCQACRYECTQLRIDLELFHQALETEKQYGKADANELTKLDGRVEKLEERRARESGRNEVLDQLARDKADHASHTAKNAHRRATWAVGAVMVIECLERTGVLSLLLKKLGG